MAASPSPPPAERRGDRSSAASTLRETILVTLDFLRWLDRQDIDLATLTQHHIDRWLVEPIGSHPYGARDFLNWAVSNRLAPRNVAIPARKVGQPRIFADSGAPNHWIRPVSERASSATAHPARRAQHREADASRRPARRRPRGRARYPQRHTMGPARGTRLAQLSCSTARRQRRSSV